MTTLNKNSDAMNIGDLKNPKGIATKLDGPDHIEQPLSWKELINEMKLLSSELRYLTHLNECLTRTLNGDSNDNTK